MKELNKKELMANEGGSFLAIIGFTLSVIAATSYVIDNWDRAKEGWEAGKIAANK